MKISINEIKSIISEALFLLNEKATIPQEIRKKSIELIYYPPGTTQTQLGKPNRRDYYIALDLFGNTIADGEEEKYVLQQALKKNFFYLRKKQGKQNFRDTTKSTSVNLPTEYISIKHGNVIGMTDRKGNWLDSLNQSTETL